MDIVNLTSVEIHGEEVGVWITPQGLFAASVNGRTVATETWKELEGVLRKAARRKTLKIPALKAVSGRGYVRVLVIGIAATSHDQSDDLLVRDEGGGRTRRVEACRLYSAGMDVDKLIALDAAAISASRALYEYRDKHRFNLGAALAAAKGAAARQAKVKPKKARK